MEDKESLENTKPNFVALTREEQLEIENIELRLTLANLEARRLDSLKQEVIRKISDRTSVTIDPNWRIDLQRGVIENPNSKLS